MGAGLHNSRRSSTSGASLGGLREKHFSFGYGTTRRPLSQPAIAECKCTSSRVGVGALTPVAKLALQAEYCARASSRCCWRCSTSCISCCSWWRCCTVRARAPRPDLALAAVRWPVWRSSADALGNAPPRPSAAAPSQPRPPLAPSLSAATHVHGAQRKPRPPRVWPAQPLRVRLQPRRVPFLPGGSSMPAPSARHGTWLIGWLRPRKSVEGRAARTRLPAVACGVLHCWRCCHIIVCCLSRGRAAAMGCLRALPLTWRLSYVRLALPCCRAEWLFYAAGIGVRGGVAGD